MIACKGHTLFLRIFLIKGYISIKYQFQYMFFFFSNIYFKTGNCNNTDFLKLK